MFNLNFRDASGYPGWIIRSPSIRIVIHVRFVSSRISETKSDYVYGYFVYIIHNYLFMDIHSFWIIIQIHSYLPLAEYSFMNKLNAMSVLPDIVSVNL